MGIASGSGRQLAYISETAFGVMPATPTMKVLRITGGALRSNKSTVTSDEIRSDRNVSDELLVGMDVTGTLNFEFSAGTLDDVLEAVMCGAWTADKLVNGTLARSLAFEERLDHGGGAYSFRRFLGCQINSLTLTVPTRGLITGSFTVMGQKEVVSKTPMAGVTYTAANTNPIETSSLGVGLQLQIPGVTDPVKVRSIELTIANNMRTRPLVGTPYTDSFGYGRADVTGSFMAYFESIDLYQAMLNHAAGSIVATLGSVAGSRYAITLPSSRLLDGEAAPGGNTDDAMITQPFRAKYDDTAKGSIVVQRAQA
ncbi:phage tail tube protein [Methylobacterium platani]|uniref:Phage tail protein n=2 Tax=Methylobacterium platani TaxID=427683 RepID=A0A179SEJ3_9HYPH|nr:phage tail tube protein [Methylobacterium platani]KMO20382.1 phage tail protein [Methylobacterium platani JCM 14648]OAS26287.1 phage tail protein [Methylobacterium platani]